MINDTASRSSPAAVTRASMWARVVQIIDGSGADPGGAQEGPARSDAAGLADHRVLRGGGLARLRDDPRSHRANEPLGIPPEDGQRTRPPPQPSSDWWLPRTPGRALRPLVVPASPTPGRTNQVQWHPEPARVPAHRLLQ